MKKILLFFILLLCIIPNFSEKDDTTSCENDQVRENAQMEVCSAQDVVDFLSEEATQQALEFHIFENPNDWEKNIFQLPPDLNKVEQMSSNSLCYCLTDNYYVYVLVQRMLEGSNPIVFMTLVNKKTNGSVLVTPETFPCILDLLQDGGTVSVNPK